MEVEKRCSLSGLGRQVDDRTLLDVHPGVDPGDDLLVLVVVLGGAVEERVGAELLDHGHLAPAGPGRRP